MSNEIQGVMGFRKTVNDEIITKSTFLHYDAYPEFTMEQIVDYLKGKSLKEVNDDFEKIILVEPSEDFPEGADESEQLQLENYQDYDLIYMYDAKEEIPSSKWVYIMDLDKNQVEVYEGGFGKLKENPYSFLQKNKDNEFVNLLITFPLDNIPSHWLQDIQIASLESNSDYFLEEHIANVLGYHRCENCGDVTKESTYSDKIGGCACSKCLSTPENIQRYVLQLEDQFVKWIQWTAGVSPRFSMSDFNSSMIISEDYLSYVIERAGKTRKQLIEEKHPNAEFRKVSVSLIG